MKKYFLLLLNVALFTAASAQKVEVPDNVYFAEQHLKIQDSGRKEIQRMVDALHRHPVYFQQKVDLADMYFPIIERIFKEEGIPEDFKYLSLQESGLQSDAVSKSNAVGYWQFKREAASDFSLRMDNQVDERKHIIESTRGAANYFKRSNKMYDNWTNTLLSYYLGPTGAKSYTKPSDVGSNKMVITDKTHQYILTFLAHKIAYENFVGKSEQPPVTLQEHKARPGQSLGEIALNTKTDPAELERYNKWLSGSTIPQDKTYIVLLPVNNRAEKDAMIASSEPVKTTTAISPETNNIPKAEFTSRNNLKAVIARKGDTKDKLALAAGISTRKLLKYNDLHSFEPIIEGEVYYIENKHNQAHVEFHTVEKDETLQSIAQKYGVKERSIRSKNRMARKEVLLEGRLLWMQSKRPSSVRVEYRKLNNNGTIQRTQAPQKKSFFKKVGEFLGITPHETEVAEVELDSVLEAENSEDETDDLLEAENTENSTDENLTDINETEPRAGNTEVKEVTETEIQETDETEAETSKEQTESLAAVHPEEALEKTAVEEPTVKTAPKTTPAETTKPATKPAEIKTPKENIKPAEVKTAAIYPKPDSVNASKKPEANQTNEKTITAAVTPAKTVAQPKADSKPEMKPVAKPAKPKMHTVLKGETLYSISREYKITVAELKEWNNLKDLTLSLGQQLYVNKPEPGISTEKSSVSTELPKSHTVLTGETLYGISTKYNISMNDLQTWNNLSEAAINVGQELLLSAPASIAAVSSEPVTKPTGETVYHTVADGESMYQISRKYNVTIKDIMDWNRKPDFNVNKGERLLIKPRTSIN